MSGRGRPTEPERRQISATKGEGDYYSLSWYLRRLDELQASAELQGKHPAAVSAIRTMAELVGLLGPQTSLVDARVQVLQLPEGLSEGALLALARGESNQQATGAGAFESDRAESLQVRADTDTDGVL